MVKPLLNMTITGAIWYQGESNQGDPYSAGPDQHSGLPMMRCVPRPRATIGPNTPLWGGETGIGGISQLHSIPTRAGCCALRWTPVLI